MLERHFQTIKPVRLEDYLLTNRQPVQIFNYWGDVFTSAHSRHHTSSRVMHSSLRAVNGIAYIAAIMTETLAWPTHYVVLNCWRFGSIAKSPLIYRLHPRPKSDESKTLCLSTLALGRMLLGFSCANRSTLYTVFCLSVLGRKLRVCQVCVVRCVITHPTFLELKHTKR